MLPTGEMTVNSKVLLVVLFVVHSTGADHEANSPVQSVFRESRRYLAFTFAKITCDLRNLYWR